MKSKAAKWPKYLSEVIRKGEQGEPGTASVVTVHHDDWCDLLNGRGQCNCNPEIEAPKPLKICEHCDGPIIERTWPNGRIEWACHYCGRAVKTGQ